MQLQVDIRGYALTALLDTGSTHNFVSLKTTDRLRLAYSSNQGFQATVANGDKIHCR
jgi:predicted aspartyl protease